MGKYQYERNIAAKCSVCEQDIFVDQYGNGDCEHCGWKQNNDCLDFPDKVRYPNRVSYDKAKQLYKEGKPFIPTFEDFVGGLFFYSEMQFDYKLRRFGVVFGDDYCIEFFEDNVNESLQVYKTKEEFMAKAYIDGNWLKDIWSDVRNANYMSCVEIKPSDKEEM